MKNKRIQLQGAILVLFLISACQSPATSTVPPTTTHFSPTGTPSEVPPSPIPSHTPIPILEGICANILYPLIPGREWTYQTIGSEGLSTMLIQITGIQQDLARIQIVDQQAEVTIDDSVRCEDGAVINFPMLFMSLMLTDYIDGVVNTYQASGITAPSRATLEQSNWQFGWEVEKLVEQPVKVEIPGLGSGHILRSNIIKFKSETTGVYESVTVPAGTFPQALLVTVEMRSPVTIGNTGVTLIVKYREWFEPNVGLLKIQTDSADLDYSGTPIPIPLNKKIELVSYQAGIP